MLRILIALSLALSAPAVVGAEARSADFAPADMTNKGLVLLSTSASSTSVAGARAMNLLRITDKGGKKPEHVGTFFIDNPFLKSHSTTEHMNVHWRALEPGDYVLEERLQNSKLCLRKVTRFTFSVSAGQAHYLGDFRLESNALINRDQYDRDLEYFTRHTNGMKPAAFSAALPERVFKDNPSCF